MMREQPLQKFRKLLVDTGYISFYLAFGNGNTRQNDWYRYVGELSPSLANLVKLFLLNQKLKTSDVITILGDDSYQELLEATVLVSSNGLTSTDQYILICFNSILFFCEHRGNPSVYFGNDSIALGVYQNPILAGVTLDLCAGSGIQAMIGAARSKRAYAVEINERAARIAQFNVRLNFLEDKVTVFNLSFDEFASQNGSIFDLITFNPPLLPVPKALRYPFVGDGGADGLTITKNILNLYISKLSAEGSIEFIGCGLGLNGELTFAKELDQLLDAHGLSGYLQLVAKSDLKTGDGIYDSLVLTAANASFISTEMSYLVYKSHFEYLGVNEMYMFFMHIGKNIKHSGATFKNITVTDISKGSVNWFIS